MLILPIQLTSLWREWQKAFGRHSNTANAQWELLLGMDSNRQAQLQGLHQQGKAFHSLPHYLPIYCWGPLARQALPGGHRGHILPAQPTPDSQNFVRENQKFLILDTANSSTLATIPLVLGFTPSV